MVLYVPSSSLLSFLIVLSLVISWAFILLVGSLGISLYAGVLSKFLALLL